MYKPNSDSEPAPLHPGEVLRVDILPHLSLTRRELAAHLCISQTALDAFLSERAGITLDLAQRLGYALGQGPRYWLALQMQYDLWQAERSVPDGVRRVAWPGHGRRRSRSLSSLTAAA